MFVAQEKKLRKGHSLYPKRYCKQVHEDQGISIIVLLCNVVEFAQVPGDAKAAELCGKHFKRAAYA